jgi:hypothetical protein
MQISSDEDYKPFWLDMTPQEREFFRQHQSETLGFDDSELPGFYVTISKFIAPRLDRFADFTMSYPSHMSCEEWRSQCKKNAQMLQGTKEEQCQAMRWVADNFEDLWS